MVKRVWIFVDVDLHLSDWMESGGFHFQLYYMLESGFDAFLLFAISECFLGFKVEKVHLRVEFIVHHSELAQN
ncbi:hypothetical protein GLYMA_13G311900v4 [Glycine max]|uniref:Uncharacterized protein n=1 Tax=Glycine max TaxID=3847 RepID=A0A0R0GWM1_SOYBN|nr:hypothetical protein JHK84_038218 [Glycine max]KRH22618.1 hypothetical protein GLYMA_13G311900v4 [Glycine max]